ncbi:MAG TPA: hypothetical protein EYM84_10775 [Flavobacteriales bacterium]|nr:hypothetical protein [Flavobacteriales bacterium]HIN40741.1 hypothetical protein [Flavobacteriales bacterium]
MLHSKIFRSLFLVVLALSCFCSYGQFYNGSYQDFGKNRVQYREFLWSFYKFEKFDVYFYTGGKELAIFTANATTQVIEETEDFFDYALEGKLQLVIYNKLNDLKQSNIGYTSDEDYNVGGVTRIVGSKIFLYFNGDHNQLIQQLREGIAEVLISQMMYGGNWKDRVKNSTLLTLPDWYLEGLISFYARGWDTEIENRVKDGILSGRYNKFNHLTGIEAKYAGHSIWNFIVERYGEALIPSILYMTKVSRNIESGLIFVLGSSLKSLSNNWLVFYRDRFYGKESITNLPAGNPILKKSKASKTYSQIKVSPDGNYIAFATNKLGKYKVYLLDLETKKKRKVFKGGYKLDRLTDYSYPLLDWHPSLDMLAIITEKNEKFLLNYYFLKSKKKQIRPIHHFQKILDFSYSNDGKKMVLSAINKGQSDIYVYNLSKNTFEQITEDIFDDLNPRFINNSNEIVFSSNRTNDTLISPNQEGASTEAIIIPKNSDIFLYNYEKKSNVLKRITNTPEINDSRAIEFDKNYISYLSNHNGTNNRMLTKFDSVISHIDTIAHYRFVTNTLPVSNYSRSIIEQDANISAKKYAEIIFSKGRYKLYVNDLAMDKLIRKGTDQKILEEQNSSDENSLFPDLGLENRDHDRTERLEGSTDSDFKDHENKIDINNYIFNIEENKEEPVQSNESLKLEDKGEGEEMLSKDTALTIVKANKNIRIIDQIYIPKKQWNYNTAFFTEYFVSQLDNRYLNETYQKFTGGGAVYTNPGLNLFLKIGISDLLEDHRIVGGMRLAGNFNNNEFFLSYENLKKRLDKQTVFHRQSFLTFRTDGTGIRVHTHDLKYGIKWPFNEVMSVRGSAIIRNDRSVTLSTDFSSLIEPPVYDTWAGLKAEFVFDNTITRGLNIYNGLRYKVFGEWFRQIDNSETNLYVTGIDFRYYQKIHRTLIWANRIAASSSFGDQKLIYYLGGVDAWLKPVFNFDTDISEEESYAYQSVATNMRGFLQNVRNGNSFAVINSEIRLPVFKYFMNRPMKSDFIKNFQIVGFGDIGTAWTGKSPYASDNSFNTAVFPFGPVNGNSEVRIINQREPIVMGYGVGLRSRLFGYFVRVDWARGIQDGIHLPHMFYWSLCLDF